MRGLPTYVTANKAEGSPVAIFPEGRLSPYAMSEFRPGAFVLGLGALPVRERCQRE